MMNSSKLNDFKKYIIFLVHNRNSACKLICCGTLGRHFPVLKDNRSRKYQRSRRKKRSCRYRNYS
ncbi:MAG: hypothetical protein UW45_C0014G0031 [Parcubacteria group bacterium GW2011_GWC2_44_22]|nr:MAG: hypothetical protein UW45_C0014G0031 [Parcubacteria group bacterium GW2011_GWC2_44_22]